MSDIYAQYGCGWSAPDGWRNFDASPTLRFVRLPILGRLYSRNEKRFPNSSKALKSRGIFRLVLPDLRQLINNYINDNSATASIKFIKDSGLSRESRDRDMKSFITEWLGNSQHLWLWDYNSIDKKFLEVEDVDRWRGSLGVECQKL